MYCYACDTRNPDDARFCVSCGQPLSQPTPAPVVEVPRRPFAPPAAPAAPAMPTNPPLAGAVPNGGAVVQNFYISNAAPAQPTMTVEQPTINLLLRAIWFFFVGLWLGQAWLVVAWLLNLTIIGLPFGVWMLNRLPQVMTLQPRPLNVTLQQNGTHYRVQRASSVPFVVRAIYFIFVGWWLSLFWLQLAWFFSATIIGLPLAFLMFERTSTITTLGD